MSTDFARELDAAERAAGLHWTRAKQWLDQEVVDLAKEILPPIVLAIWWFGQAGEAQAVRFPPVVFDEVGAAEWMTHALGFSLKPWLRGALDHYFNLPPEHSGPSYVAGYEFTSQAWMPRDAVPYAIDLLDPVYREKYTALQSLRALAGER